MADEPTPRRTSGLDAQDLTRRWTLVAAVTATFLVMLDSTAVMTVLPDLRAELNADFSGQQWVIAAHAVPPAAFLLTGGALADRFGHRSAFRLGALLFTGGAVAAGAAGTLFVLTLARGIQGIGSAFLLATASTLVAHGFPGPARARALRLLSTAAAVGLALGPPVGGLLAEVDWRLVFLSVLPAGVLLQAIGKVRLREVRPTASAALDWLGFTLSSACVALVVLGLLRGQALGWTSTSVLAMFTAATAFLFVFLLTQRARGDRAVLELALFGNRTFLGISLTTFVFGAISLSTVFLAINHLRTTLGHSSLATGVCLLAFTVALIGTSLFTREFVTQLPPGVAVGMSAVLVTLGAGLLILVTPDSTWPALLPSMILLGTGVGTGTSLRYDLSTRSVAPSKAGVAIRINETCHHLGLAAGVTGLGALYQYRVLTYVEQGGITTAVAELTAEHTPATAFGIVREASAASLGFVAVVCLTVGAIFTLIAFTYINRGALHDPAASR
ncbi:MFS transporter [Saccharothrix saharensis]|uniref:MFS transporter n=1 Tax=Saccharothrix saharensis TaxID=571190 RepID=A0A543JNT2_9PSEU|nr:MFS transporter [Saccharothrix saharensis]TQM84502.1 MFS transporter [Saccharothrix saharensis]